MAQQTFPEQNQIAVADLKLPITIDVTARFAEGIKKLLELMQVSRRRSVVSGTQVRILGGYDVTLEDGNVAEGELIPLSKVKEKEVGTKTITLEKYRKATTAEAIQTYGLDKAINDTDDALVRRIQKEVRKDFIAAVKTGTGTETAVAHGLQGALATAWGKLEVLFEDYDSTTTVAFVNPMDAAKYLGQAGITTQTAFGLTFLTGFTNTVIVLDSQIEAGTIWATVPENIEMIFVNPTTSEVARAFGLTGDASGFIGMKHFLSNESATHQTLIMSGILLHPERIDGIVKVAITSGV